MTVEVRPGGRRRRGPMTEEQKAAMHARTLESERRFNEAVARMPDLPPEQMSEDGCLNLVAGFWEHVRHDLACKDRETREWVESGDGFLAWCDISHQDPDDLRAFLLSVVWGNPDHLRKGGNVGSDE